MASELPAPMDYVIISHSLGSYIVGSMLVRPEICQNLWQDPTVEPYKEISSEFNPKHIKVNFIIAMFLDVRGGRFLQ